MSNQSHPDSYSFGTSIKGVCEYVSVYLNDSEPGFENQRWSRDLIKATIRDAMFMVAELVPTAFSDTVKWTLEADTCIQDLPEGCDKLIEIVCIRDLETGERVSISEIDEAQIARNNIYPTRCSTTCNDDSDGTASFQYSISSTADKFGLAPSPEESDRYQVEALCASISSLTDSVDECQEFPDNFKPWMLPLTHLVTGLLLMRNRSDANLVAQSQSFLSTFSLLSNISLTRLLAVAGVADS